VLVHEPKKAFYMSFLHSPFPVESSLLSQLHDHVNAEICASGTIRSVGDFLDYLSWTFFFRRLLLNPSYYGLEGTDADSLNKFLLDLVLGVLGDLERAGLIMQDDEQKLVPLALGKIASFYYLNYRTMVVFSERLKPDSDAERLLVVLANAKEFEELPVRHNEDKVSIDRGVLLRGCACVFNATQCFVAAPCSFAVVFPAFLAVTSFCLLTGERRHEPLDALAGRHELLRFPAHEDAHVAAGAHVPAGLRRAGLLPRPQVCARPGHQSPPGHGGHLRRGRLARCHAAGPAAHADGRAGTLAR